MATKQRLITLLKFAFVGFLFYFCLQFFIPRWESLQLSDRLGTLSVPWITAAGIFTLAYYILGFFTWTTILRSLGCRPNLQMITRAYVYSLLPKYIPGNVAAHGLRIQLASKAGVPVIVSMKSFLLEAVFAVGTATVISIPGTMYLLPAVVDGVFTWVIIIFVFVLMAIVATRRYNLNSIHEFGPRPTGYFKLVLLYLLLWFASGAAHWCLANALSFYSLSRLPQLITAVSASWALGFVSIFTPAGLGVREAVLYFFVTSWMEETDIIIFVTLSRLLMFGVEVLLTLGVVLYSKISIRRVT